MRTSRRGSPVLCGYRQKACRETVKMILCFKSLFDMRELKYEKTLLYYEQNAENFIRETREVDLVRYKSFFE